MELLKEILHYASVVLLFAFGWEMIEFGINSINKRK